MRMDHDGERVATIGHPYETAEYVTELIDTPASTQARGEEREQVHESNGDGAMRTLLLDEPLPPVPDELTLGNELTDLLAQQLGVDTRVVAKAMRLALAEHEPDVDTGFTRLVRAYSHR